MTVSPEYVKTVQFWPFDFPTMSRSSTFLHQTDVASYSWPCSFHAYQHTQLISDRFIQIFTTFDSTQTATICIIKMNCSLSYHLHFLIMLQGRKAGERMRGYERKKICLSAWAAVGLSAMKVNRKRWESSELWEETQRGITGSHATTEAWCCLDTLREAVTQSQSLTLRNKIWQ